MNSMTRFQLEWALRNMYACAHGLSPQASDRERLDARKHLRSAIELQELALRIHSRAPEGDEALAELGDTHESDPAE